MVWNVSNYNYNYNYNYNGLERLNLYWNIRCSTLEQTHFFMEQNEQRFGTFVFILEHLHYIVENPMFNNETKQIFLEKKRLNFEKKTFFLETKKYIPGENHL